MDKQPKTKTPAFALGGEIVKTPAHALRILTRATMQKQHWLIPQARNVHALLKRAQEAL